MGVSRFHTPLDQDASWPICSPCSLNISLLEVPCFLFFCELCPDRLQVLVGRERVDCDENFCATLTMAVNHQLTHRPCASLLVRKRDLRIDCAAGGTHRGLVLDGDFRRFL